MIKMPGVTRNVRWLQGHLTRIKFKKKNERAA